MSFQRVHDADGRGGGGEVFERVAAQSSKSVINRSVQLFEDFRQKVKADGIEQVSSTDVSRWEHHKDENEQKKRAELYEYVGAKIPRSGEFSTVPVEDASETE